MPIHSITPIIEQRADPCIYRHSDGYYYFTASVPQYDRIELRRARHIDDLPNAPTKDIWKRYAEGPMSANIWAPELHFLNGVWYIYFAAAKDAGTHDGLFDHRIFVLENCSANPLKGTWIEKGQLKTQWETFCLDATVLNHCGSLYLVWAQKDPDIEGNSNLYICGMQNPWTLRGSPVMISTPLYDWETHGFRVNEGPACLVHGERIFITFSASATDHHYCVGLLYADYNADLLDARSWTKLSYPVLSTDESKGLYGPGHNNFTTTEGGEELLVFHARTYKEIVGDPLYDPNRHTFIATINWDEQGFPCFKIE